MCRAFAGLVKMLLLHRNLKSFAPPQGLRMQVYRVVASAAARVPHRMNPLR
ncbi:unnamed protein product (plasmid) [Mycetohabitans rhizoxinica HKI 454]|uniref:Uncharacterized protein n=1 Tax=Mycetohabitans rhizoxinica (strain DSM 19002 / CIP 109453 / HKI 454) TaxID=882378 RepID=E5AU54_MYCRK|nr:unnamed protein product [Mycetohabitans rhizoxinica HKI 454]